MPRRYSPEFRSKVLDLPTAGRTVARNLRIHPEALRTWSAKPKSTANIARFRFLEPSTTMEAVTWHCFKLATRRSI